MYGLAFSACVFSSVTWKTSQRCTHTGLLNLEKVLSFCYRYVNILFLIASLVTYCCAHTEVLKLQAEEIQTKQEQLQKKYDEIHVLKGIIETLRHDKHGKKIS